MTRIADVFDNMAGALRIMGVVIARPLVWGHCRHWGATPDELSRAYPGDERVPRPITGMTLAVTIPALAHEVWPWVAQLGQERGGMYSYELLENVAECKIRNATRVVSEWEMVVGDLMRMGPPGFPVLQVVALERSHWLLMAGADPKTGRVDPLPQPGQSTYTNFTWLLYLDELPKGRTRVISHSRLDYAPRKFVLKLIWKLLTDPIAYVMTRKMLMTIKQRVMNLQA